MSQTAISVPEFISEEEAWMDLAIKLFEVGRLSWGRAAALTGYSKRTFTELLGKHGVVVMDYPAQQLQDDRGHASCSDGFQQ